MKTVRIRPSLEVPGGRFCGGCHWLYYGHCQIYAPLGYDKKGNYDYLKPIGNDTEKHDRCKDDTEAE